MVLLVLLKDNYSTDVRFVIEHRMIFSRLKAKG